MSQRDQGNQPIQVQKLIATAQSQEVDRKDSFGLNRKSSQKMGSKVGRTPRAQGLSSPGKSPRPSSKGKSNGKAEPNSSQVIIQEQQSQSPGNSTTVIKSPANQTNSSKSGAITASVTHSHRGGEGRKLNEKTGGRTATGKSGGGSSANKMPLTAEQKVELQQKSYRDVWEQPKNPFIAAKTVHRVFNNAHITLGQMLYQPQASCSVYQRMRERVTNIDANNKRKHTRLAQFYKSTKSQESREPNFSVHDQDSAASATRFKSVSSANKSNFKLQKQTNIAARKKIIPQMMPTVSEFQELSQIDNGGATENAQASIPLLQTEIPPFDGKSMIKRQQTQAVRANPSSNLKEITEISQFSKVDVLGQQQKLISDFGSDARLGTSQVAMQDQQKWEEKLDQIMLSKLVRGEKVGGRFARVKIEGQRENESCVFQLTDFKPKNLKQKNERDKSKNRSQVQDLQKKAYLEAEEHRNIRLEKQMRQVVTIAKQRLGQNPEGKATLQEIIENLGMDGEMISSDEESDWNAMKELKKFSAGSKHRKDFERRLKQKLIKMGKIQSENELKHVDSLIESAYNSQKASAWGKDDQEILKDPHPSEVSSFQFSDNADLGLGVYTDSELSAESDDSADIQEKIKKEGRLKLSMKNNPLDEMKMAMLGFEQGFSSKNGGDLINKVKEKITELNNYGTVIPDATQKVIYKKLCGEYKTAPIDVFKKMNAEKTSLVLQNYALNENQAKPVSLIIPYMDKLENLVLKDCNVSDTSAAIIIQSSLGGADTKLRRIDLSGIEMGIHFIKRLRKCLKQNPDSLHELIMSRLKLSVSIGRLTETLQFAQSLEYLDMSENMINQYSVDALGDFLKKSESLEYLNLSGCGLRGLVAEKVMDALMLNTTIKYLIINNNRLNCSNNMIAAKLGRVIQGHPQLLHIDISYCKLLREELIFQAMCVRDSKNVQGLHLTGNTFSPHDRLLMRAILSCKTKWPLPPNYVPKFEKISGSDKITLVMLNLCFMMAVPPNYIAEIGLSEVNSVQEVRKKIRSFEQRKMFEDEIKWKNEKEFLKTEVHYKELLEKSLEGFVMQKAHDLESEQIEQQIQATLKGPSFNYTFDQYYNDPEARFYDMFQMIDFYGRKRKCLELGITLNNDEDKPKSVLNMPSKNYNVYRDLKKEIEERIEVSNTDIEKLLEQIKNFQATLESDDKLPDEAREKVEQKIEKLEDSISNHNGKVCLLTYIADDKNFDPNPRVRKQKRIELLKSLEEQEKGKNQLGTLLSACNDNLYRDQRVRVRRRIQVLKDTDPRSVPDYFDQMVRLREQVSDLRFLGSDKERSIQKAAEKSIQETMLSDDSLAELDDMIIPPMITNPDFEQEEKMLKKRLKVITKDKHEEKQREAILKRQNQNTRVIQLVKQLVSLPPNNVPEIGAFSNPMRQQKDELVFSRITGHPNALDNDTWYDTNECWICGEHNKMNIVVTTMDRHVDSEFTQIILLTAMMSRRAEKRIEYAREYEKENFEALLEEKSRKSHDYSESVSETSGSGPDILGKGDTAYRNQEKSQRKKNLFSDANDEEKGVSMQLMVPKVTFDADQDDDSVCESESSIQDTSEQARKKINRKKFQQIDKSDQARSVNFRTFTKPKNLVVVQNKYTKSIAISKDPKSNLTLFNPALTARPVQLKNVLKSVYSEYVGADGPDRFNQLQHQYHLYNGILYRNLHNNQQISEGMKKPAGSRKQNSVSGFASGKARRGDVSGRNTNQENQQAQTIDLTSSSLLFRTDKMLTKFDIQDSTLSTQIQKLQEKEREKLQITDAFPHVTSSSFHADSSTNLPSTDHQSAVETLDSNAHQMWLQKRGVGPGGQMPPLRIKASGHEYMPNDLVPKTAAGGSRPRRNLDINNISLNGCNAQSARRHAQSSHMSTRVRKQEVKQNHLEKDEFSAGKKQNRETHIAYNPKIRPKMDAEDNYQQFWALFNQKEEFETIYLVSSVNHWMPIKLADSEFLAKKVLARIAGEPDPVDEMKSKSERSSITNRLSSLSQQRKQPKRNLTNKFLGTQDSFDVNEEEEDEDPIHRKLRIIKNSFNRFNMPNRIKQPVVVNAPLDIVSQQSGEASMRQHQATCKGPHRHEFGSEKCTFTRVQTGEEFQNKFGKYPKRNKMRSSRHHVMSEDFSDDDNLKEMNLFCRPGRHHFFFVRDGKHFMLSKRYPMEHFKETNVQMNYIDVAKRGWKLCKPLVDRDEEWKKICQQTAVGDQSFDKSRSVFRNFRLDTPATIEKMFENDLRLTKIPHKIKDKDQFVKVRQALLDHYPYVKNMFLTLSCDSSYPAINRTDFDIWCSNCSYHSRPGVDEAKINLQREGSLVKNELTKKISDGTTKNDMLRFQFLEVIFRLAELCYQNEIKQESAMGQQQKQPKKKKGSGGKIYLFQAINKIFKDHIMHENQQTAETQAFRDEHLYTYKVNYFYERNELIMQRMHKDYNCAGRYFLTPSDAVNFVCVVGGLTFLKERLIVRLYGFSKQSNIDYAKTPSQPKELSFVEFLEFFGRVAFMIFLESNLKKYDDMPIHERLDALLAHYCKKLRIQGMLSSMKQDQSDVVDDIIEYMKEQARAEKVLAADSVAIESGSGASLSLYDQSKASPRGGVLQSNSRDHVNVKLGIPQPSPDLENPLGKLSILLPLQK